MHTYGQIKDATFRINHSRPITPELYSIIRVMCEKAAKINVKPKTKKHGRSKQDQGHQD